MMFAPLFQSLCLLAATVIAGPSLAASHPGPPTIDVEGVVEVSIAPNQATVRLGVESFDAKAATAIKDNDRRTKAVLAALGGAGIAARDRQTDMMRVNEGNHHRKRRTSEFGTLVTRNVSVTVRDLGKLEAVLKAVMKAGATDLHEVKLGHSDLNAHKAKARLEAVKAARAKAQAMAAAIGQGIGPARHLTDAPRGSGWGVTAPVYANAFMNAGGESLNTSTIATGRIVIKMNIGATFELTTK